MKKNKLDTVMKKRSIKNVETVSLEITEVLQSSFKDIPAPDIFLGILLSTIEHCLSDIDNINGLTMHKKNEARKTIICKMERLYKEAIEAYLQSTKLSTECNPEVFNNVLEVLKEEKGSNFIDHERGELLKTKH